MASPYDVNKYEGIEVDRTINLDVDVTDQKQAQSVREILSRFSRNEVAENNSKSSVEGEYAAEFADDIPLDSPSIQDLLDMPDLSDCDEMDMMDYIRDNTSDPVNDNSFSSHDEPPSKPTSPEGSSSSAEPAPSE